MRTLLTDPFPPQSVNEQTFSPGTEPSPQPAGVARTFPPAAVLASVDDLVEVGVDGAAIATPGASSAEQAVVALERGVAISPQQAFRANDLSSSPRRTGADYKQAAKTT